MLTRRRKKKRVRKAKRKETILFFWFLPSFFFSTFRTVLQCFWSLSFQQKLVTRILYVCIFASFFFFFFFWLSPRFFAVVVVVAVIAVSVKLPLPPPLTLALRLLSLSVSLARYYRRYGGGCRCRPILLSSSSNKNFCYFFPIFSSSSPLFYLFETKILFISFFFLNFFLTFFFCRKYAKKSFFIICDNV